MNVICKPVSLVVRRCFLTCGAFAALFVPIAQPHAAPGAVVHFSGPVFIANQPTLPALSAFADCEGRERIFGYVRDGRYAVDLSAHGRCTVYVGERDWESQPQPVFDASRATPLPVLVYARDVPEPALASELLQMGEQDQAFRRSWDGNPDSPLAREGLAQDEVRRQRLAEIIAAKGWPTISMVGFEAANAAWLVAQHTPPEQLARARSWLALMQTAAIRHEISPANLATSIDRVLVYENKAQRYGTQFRTGDDGSAKLYPVDDVENLDERRRAVGLPPLAVVVGPSKERDGASRNAMP